MGIAGAVLSFFGRVVPPDYRPVCPECGAPVVYDLACHTYPQSRADGSVAFMACMPCDSAIEYWCRGREDDEEGCGWEYTHGLNPRNPRSAENESRRPPWIPEGLSVCRPAGDGPMAPMLATAVPGVRAAWDRGTA